MVTCIVPPLDLNTVLNFLYFVDISEILSRGGVKGVCMETLQRPEEAPLGAQQFAQASGNERGLSHLPQVQVLWQIRGRSRGGEEEVRPKVFGICRTTLVLIHKRYLHNVL